MDIDNQEQAQADRGSFLKGITCGLAITAIGAAVAVANVIPNPVSSTVVNQFQRISQSITLPQDPLKSATPEQIITSARHGTASISCNDSSLGGFMENSLRLHPRENGEFEVAYSGATVTREQVLSALKRKQCSVELRSPL